MNLFGTFKSKLILGGFGALLAAGIAAGAGAAGMLPASLTAAKPTPAASPSQSHPWCNDFMGHLAGILGVTPDQLHGDSIKAADQTIDDAVTAGKISASKAAALKKRIASRPACEFSPRFDFGKHREGGALRGELVSAAARTLGITADQLRQDIRQGKTLQSLAGGMSESEFRTKLIANVKADLDAQVKAGKLTQAQEDKIVSRLQTAPIPFWSKPAHREAPGQ